MRLRRNMGKLSSRCVGDGPVRRERKLAYSPNAAQARLVLSKLLGMSPIGTNAKCQRVPLTSDD
jgi:hypothetical protein